CQYPGSRADAEPVARACCEGGVAWIAHREHAHGVSQGSASTIVRRIRRIRAWLHVLAPASLSVAKERKVLSKVSQVDAAAVRSRSRRNQQLRLPIGLDDAGEATDTPRRLSGRLRGLGQHAQTRARARAGHAELQHARLRFLFPRAPTQGRESER